MATVEEINALFDTFKTAPRQLGTEAQIDAADDLMVVSGEKIKQLAITEHDLAVRARIFERTLELADKPPFQNRHYYFYYASFAIELLGQLGNPQAIDTLMGFAKIRQFSAIGQAAAQLASYNVELGKKALDAIGTILRVPGIDPTVQTHTIETFLLSVIEPSDDYCKELSDSAARKLASSFRLYNFDVMKRLLTRRQGEEYPTDVRYPQENNGYLARFRFIVDVFVHTNEKRAITVLREFLQDRSQAVRQIASEALVKLSSPDHLPTLRSRSGHEFCPGGCVRRFCG